MVAQFLDQVIADRGGVFEQALLVDRVQHRECRGAGDRIAAKRGAVSAGSQAGGHFGRASIAPMGSPPPSALASVMMSGFHAVMLMGKELAGASDPDLHLVEHQQQLVAIAQFAQAFQILGAVRHHDSAFALNRLDQNRGGLFVDCGVDRLDDRRS